MTHHVWLLFGDAGAKSLPGILYAADAGALGTVQEDGQIAAMKEPAEVFVLRRDGAENHDLIQDYRAFYLAEEALRSSGSLPQCAVTQMHVPVPAGTISDLVGTGRLIRQGFQVTYGQDGLDASVEEACTQRGDLSLLLWCRQWAEADGTPANAIRKTIQSKLSSGGEAHSLRVFLLCAGEDPFGIAGALSAAAWMRNIEKELGVSVQISLGMYLDQERPDQAAGSLTVCTEALKAGASEGLLDELYPLGLPAQYDTDAVSPFLQLLMVSALQDSLQAHPDPAALRLLCHPGAAFSWSVLSRGWADCWQAFALRCVELALKGKPAGDAEWDRARAFAGGFFSWLGSLMDTAPMAFRMGKAMDAAAYHAAYSLRSLLGQYAVLALMEHDAARDGMLEESTVHRTGEVRETAAEQMVRAIQERKAALETGRAALEKHWRIIGGAARDVVIRRALERAKAGWEGAERQRLAMLQELIQVPEGDLPVNLQGSGGQSKLAKLEKHTLMLRAQRDACEEMLADAAHHLDDQPEFPGNVGLVLCQLTREHLSYLNSVLTLPFGHRSREQAVVAMKQWVTACTVEGASKTEDGLDKAYVPPVWVLPFGVEMEKQPETMGFVSLPVHLWQTLLDSCGAWGGCSVLYPHALPLQPDLRRAMAHREEGGMLLAHWRGALAAALLFDGWKQDSLRITLRLREIPPDSMQRRGLDWMTWSGSVPQWVTLADVKQTWVLGQADPQYLMVPMVPGSQSLRGLPARVTWMDASETRFLDPTPFLHATDRDRLMEHLRHLMELDTLSAAALSEVKAWIWELQAAGRVSGDEENGIFQEDFEDVLLRMAVVYGLSPEHGYEGLARQEDRFVQPTQPNPLKAALLGKGCPVPTRDHLSLLSPSVTFLWHGVPFARLRDGVGLEPTGHPMEAEMMDSFAHQVEVLLHQSPHWQAELKQRLTRALSGGELKLSDGMRKQMIQRLALLEGLSAQSHVAELTAPWDETSPAIHMLLDEMLGVRHAQNILGERLLLVEGEGAPLGIPVTMEGERIPLSAGLPLEEVWHAHFLPDAMGEAPLLQMDDEKTSVISTQEYIQVTLEVKGKGRLRVTRRYDASACMLVSGEELPGLSLEPALRLPAKAWKRYTIKCHDRPDFRGEAWQRGAWVDIPDGEKVLSDFPAALRLTCHQEGAACTNLFFLRRKVMDIVPKGSAVVGVDLGSTAAGVLVRIGTEAVPVVLRGGAEPLMGMNAPGMSSGEAGPLFDMSWSPEGRLMSADLTLADVLGDGAALRQRELLWGISADRRQVLTAYLEQLLRKISWFVVLMGGEDVVWRFSVPALLPLPRRDELLALLELMVHQVAEETGLPLTYGMSPCLMALDVDALGYVYRGEEKGGHRGSVLMVDVGGHGLSASLWLRGMSKRIMGFTLPMGIRTLLLQWLILHPDTLLEDRHVLGEDQEDLQETEQAMALLRRSTGSLSGLEQAQGMMDAYLGERVHTLLRAEEAENQGEDGTVMQALILMYFSWLFTMVGLMMESASSDALLNDRLPPKLTVRVCGRGAQLMAALPPDAQERVHGFLRLPGISTNPVAIMEVTHSAFPKREAAMGLAMMTQVEMETERLTHVLSSPQQFQRDMAEGLMETMRSFLLHFDRQFPGFMDLVLPGWVKQGPRLALSEEAVQAIRRWAVSTAAQGGESLQWMECVSTGLSFLLEAHGRG